jgi:PAS domain S-box-containing protein
LSDEKERLRTTLASIGDAVIATDTEGRITNMNAVAESLTAWTLADAVGKPLAAVFRIVNQKTGQEVGNPAQRALGEGVIVGLANHTILIRKDGTERPIDDSAAPIRDALGHILGCVLVFRDITERRRVEQQLADDAARIASIVNHVISGIIAIDEKGTVEAFNPAAERLFGYTVEEVIGQNVKMLMPEPFHSEHDGYIANYLRTGQAKIIGIGREVEGRRKDGSTFPMDLAVSKFEYSGRRYFTGIVGDITERKQAEEALRQSESTLRKTAEDLRAKEAELDLVISRTPLLLIRCSRDRRYVFVNRAAAEFLGRPAEEIIGHPIVEIMGEAAVATVTPYIDRVLQGESVEFEIEIPYARPGRRFMRVLYTPDHDASGDVIGWVATLSDITERRQLERERDERAAELAVALGKRTEEAKRAEKAEQLLREADRRKDEFLATLAHELRNPLAPLLNALELMRRADDNKPLMEQARGMMERQTSQLVRLVDDLLDISRITQGKLQLRKERVALGDVLVAAIEIARPLIDASAHELTVTMPPQAIHVQADRIRLAQVFSNLLNNAAKYTEKAGHIWLTAERQGDEVVISVRDTGIGISPEHMEQIFKMFSQMAPALERSQGGLGIGLSVVKGLVELHGGTIEARSGGPGKGSEFTVHLPAVDVPTERPQEPDDDGEKVCTGRKCRILVVDDLRVAADSMAMLLQMMGHDTRTAYDGLEALQTAAAFQPDVVVLDIGLPKMDGYDVARHIRREPWGGKMALVALTGWGMEEDKRRALEAGFDHHLTKPVKAADLEKLLAGHTPVGQE